MRKAFKRVNWGWTIIMTLAACTIIRPHPPQAAQVELTWTAPGDDGNVGTCSEYDIRYSQDSTLLVGWTSATQVAGEPAPKPAGAVEMDTISVGNGTWYVGIRARDEAFNWSGISNVLRVSIDQIVPASIADFRYRIIP